MNQFLDWLAMGGYSIYVWPAYGLVCVVFLLIFLSSKWKKKQTRQQLHLWFNWNLSDIK